MYVVGNGVMVWGVLICCQNLAIAIVSWMTRHDIINLYYVGYLLTFYNLFDGIYRRK